MGEPVVLSHGRRGLVPGGAGGRAAGQRRRRRQDQALAQRRYGRAGGPLARQPGLVPGGAGGRAAGQRRRRRQDQALAQGRYGRAGGPLARQARSWSLAVLADGRLASGGVDGKIKLWPETVWASRWSSRTAARSGPWRCWRTGGWPAAAQTARSSSGPRTVWASRWSSRTAAGSGPWRCWRTGGWPAAAKTARSSSGRKRVWASRWSSRHGSRVLSLAVLADGRLASGGGDGKIKLWPQEGMGEPVVLSHGSPV